MSFRRVSIRYVLRSIVALSLWNLLRQSIRENFRCERKIDNRRGDGTVEVGLVQCFTSLIEVENVHGFFPSLHCNPLSSVVLTDTRSSIQRTSDSIRKSPAFPARMTYWSLGRPDLPTLTGILPNAGSFSVCSLVRQSHLLLFGSVVVTTSR